MLDEVFETRLRRCNFNIVEDDKEWDEIKLSGVHDLVSDDRIPEMDIWISATSQVRPYEYFSLRIDETEDRFLGTTIAYTENKRWVFPFSVGLVQLGFRKIHPSSA